MKYKKDDLVRIKSFQWWDEQEKDEYGDAAFKVEDGLATHTIFPKYTAKKFCGMIGEVFQIGNMYLTPYFVIFGGSDSWWDFHEDWIERKVERIDIHLKYMKSEI